MIAAIYARKSTEQLVSDEQKSVARQVEHASAYATRKGWTVDQAHIYTDDGISGAEFAKRPGFLRLMNALKPRPAFNALIMSEESRLGREAIETAYSFKQLVPAGVRVFFYLEDRERTLDSPTDKIMLSLTAFATCPRRMSIGRSMGVFAQPSALKADGNAPLCDEPSPRPHAACSTTSNNTCTPAHSMGTWPTIRSFLPLRWWERSSLRG